MWTLFPEPTIIWEVLTKIRGLAKCLAHRTSLNLICHHWQVKPRDTEQPGSGYQEQKQKSRSQTKVWQALRSSLQTDSQCAPCRVLNTLSASIGSHPHSWTTPDKADWLTLTPVRSFSGAGGRAQLSLGSSSWWRSHIKSGFLLLGKNQHYCLH